MNNTKINLQTKLNQEYKRIQPRKQPRKTCIKVRCIKYLKTIFNKQSCKRECFVPITFSISISIYLSICLSIYLSIGSILAYYSIFLVAVIYCIIICFVVNKQLKNIKSTLSDRNHVDVLHNNKLGRVALHPHSKAIVDSCHFR